MGVEPCKPSLGEEFSKEEISKKEKGMAKRWCLVFFLTLALLLAGLCAFNALVDPFGVFGDPVFHWWSYDETNNPRAAKISYLEQHHDEYDSYIIGASSTSSFSKEALDRYFDADFYNLIMYGSDMLDVERTCDYLLDHYQVKHLVVNMYISNGYRYDESNDNPTRRLHQKVSGENPLLFYGRYLLIDPRYSWEKLKAARRDTFLSQPFDVFDEESGAYDKRARDAEPIGAMDQYLKAYPVFQDYPQESRRLEHTDEAVGSLRRIQERCREQGVDLLVVSAPAYYDSLLWYDREDVKEFYLKMAEVTPFWDFSVSSVSQEPRYFYDETHFRNAVGDMALARIFEDDSVYVPEDFGVLVTPENAASHVDGFWEVENRSSDYTAEVPILLYHHIAEETNENTITEEQFRAEMKLLRDRGFHTVTFDQMISYVEQGTDLPDNPVCITFDDGYRSNYETAYPILKEYGMNATIFVIGSTVGNTERYKDTEYAITPHFSYQEAREMTDSGLISVQSHTYDMHQWEPYETGDFIRSNILKLENETEQEYIDFLTADFQRSRDELEQATEKPVNVLAFPGGSSDTLSQYVLSSLGVKATLSIESGKAVLVKGLDQSLYAMNRFYVTPETTEEQFLSWIS